MRRLLAVLVVVFMLAVPVGAHTISGYPHSSTCDGFFGYDHGMLYDGGGWYHTLSRFANQAGMYTVTKKHYQKDLVAGFIFKHQSFKSNCKEGPASY